LSLPAFDTTSIGGAGRQRCGAGDCHLKSAETRITPAIPPATMGDEK
jgi:hypothetical protein